jgi:hypothetical protein
VARRVVAYLRVAPRERAADRPDIDAQRAAIERAGRERGWTLVAVEQDRRSGRTLRRSGLQAALARARAGEADAIAVSRLDRLTYSLPDLADLVRMAVDDGFAIVAIEDGLDLADADGALVGAILATGARWNPRPLLRPVRAGRPGRPSSTPASPAERSRGLRADGMTLQAICDLLNEEGVPTPRGGTRWRPTSLRAIVRESPTSGS